MREMFNRLWNDPKTANKFIAALIGAVVVAVSVGLLPASVSGWVVVVTAFLTALGVYAVPNRQERNTHD